MNMNCLLIVYRYVDLYIYLRISISPSFNLPISLSHLSSWLSLRLSICHFYFLFTFRCEVLPVKLYVSTNFTIKCFF